MRSCLTDMELAALISGSVPVVDRREMHQHLLACERCRETLTRAVIALRETLAPERSSKPVGQQMNQDVLHEVRAIMARLEDDRSQ